MTPKIARPQAVQSTTICRYSHCGKIFVTVSMKDGAVFEVFIRFGKAGGCASATSDGIARLLSYGLRSGLDVHDAIKALSGIQCHMGSKTCVNAFGECLRFVQQHLATGEDLNDIIEAYDFGTVNQGA